MIYSMTGYARTAIDLPEKQITIEIRSLNSKTTDINIRIPSFYREKEIEIRKKIAEKLIRGKIDLYISVDWTEDQTNVEFNNGVIENYISQLSPILKNKGLNFNEEIFRSVLSLPNVYKIKKQELEEEEWHSISNAIEETCIKLMEFREQEGENLNNQIFTALNKIESLLSEIEAYEKERMVNIREKLKTSLEKENLNYDKERFEQELIYYLDKIDIAEEKTRLKSHINYFKEVAADNTKIAKGKKLTFIAQEIGREINTLGVKSAHEKIQKAVVQQKDALEQIKEQLANIL